MRAFTLFALLGSILLTGCGPSEWDKAEAEAVKGTVWLIDGYRIEADGQTYYCAYYEVRSGGAAIGGDALFAGGDAVSVNTGAQSYILRLYDRPGLGARVINEMNCARFLAHSERIRSRWPYSYRPE